MQFKIQKGNGLKGEITVPGDKSISHRAIMLASLADGKSEISGFLEGEDCLATIEVFQKMGVIISRHEKNFVIEGKGIITFEDREDIPVKRGSIVFTPSGVVHGVETDDSERLILMLIKGPGITAKEARYFMHGK